MMRLVSFSFKAGVKARLARPLSQWRAGETFDVSGVKTATNVTVWHDVLYLRAEGLDVLREWETTTPFLALHGSAGIGKSTLLQLAAMRALVLGESVLMHACNESKLIELVDDERLRVQRDGRAKNAVVCFDSPKGFHHAFGHCDVFRKTLIVHAPSGDLYNTSKADGVRTRLFTPPPLDELVALGALEGIDADEVRRRVARYGPNIRHIYDGLEAEHVLQSGVSDLARCLFHLHDPEWIERVDGVTLMLPKPGGIGFMRAFASDVIRDRVVQIFKQANQTARLRQFADNAYHHRGSLGGQVFERCMLDALGRAGAEIQLKTQDGDKRLRIAGDGVALRLVDSDLALPADETLRLGVLYRLPQSNSAAAWDALLVESDALAFLLQMTVSNHLQVTQYGLAAGKALLERAGFRGELRLVLLAPPVVFARLCLPQPIANWQLDKWQVAAVNNVDHWLSDKAQNFFSHAQL